MACEQYAAFEYEGATFSRSFERLSDAQRHVAERLVGCIEAVGDQRDRLRNFPGVVLEEFPIGRHRVALACYAEGVIISYHVTAACQALLIQCGVYAEYSSIPAIRSIQWFEPDLLITFD